MRKGWLTGPMKTRKPVARSPIHPDTGGTQGEQFLPGPVSIAHADVQVHVLGRAGSGHHGRTQAATCWKASWSWPGPDR